MGRRRERIKHELNGVTFRSGFERQAAEQLNESGMGFEYEHAVVTYVEPAKTRKYIPDFYLENGIIIEAKGIWDLDDRKKIASVREQNPDLDIRMLFQRDHPLNKGAKMRYSEWCQKRGIPYAVGTIPQEWLNEKPKKRGRKAKV